MPTKPPDSENADSRTVEELQRQLDDIHPEKRTVAEMIGEFCREASVLVLVFGFLDRLQGPAPLKAGWIGAILLTSAMTLLVGITIERNR